ncbi:hypothetical protein CNMCM6936_003644 [Aspergillus lentulus]|uniref:F-box domain-containing protein n=1 Tax=Aspergillus lentulus TaxID=293939 RepID=A0ABQ1ABZ2_ASPLE|nr:hypothetical protein CNMCM6069_002990 [Aspergillus lentulus]KAF4168049.1 hypothetical protein CNMCM6936_003644 [Aspergillus lentulus]KAF4171548.1 hypothetical protein CNMCM8060_002817 [Aspergillus lentulus]KAF4189743.1 hypothetical protein CNMCM8694_003947 [Aspergillus lentulus]GFF70705.1 hypothetical protein IFM47457_02704 [Aspergillus lentulus]
MAQPRPLDGLSLLPGPVLEMVLVQLDDLAALYSIYRSSPAVFRLLHEDSTARRIFQRIMELSVPAQTQVLIRKFTFLRWNVRPAKDLDDFIEKYIKDDTAFEFPHDIPLSVLCDSLAAAATIRYLAHAGMHEMIARCQQLELMQLQNPNLKYIRNPHRTPALWNSEYFPVPKPPRERYQQADAIPVSTIEEQRAIRAIWQLLLVWELHSFVYGQSHRWNWPSEEVSRLQNIHFEEIWWHALRNQDIEPIRTMNECSCLFPTLQYPGEKLRAAKNLAFTLGWKFPCDCSSPNASLVQDIDDMEFRRGAPGYSFVLGRLSKWYTSPCRYVTFRPFRRYGFAIWDLRRMQGLGLLWAPADSPQLPQAPRSEPDQYVRWESILNQEDLEEIEQRRKHYWPGTEIVAVEDPWSVTSRA